MLSAAAALLDESGVQGVTLTEIARRSGFTKSNLYRYFESREAILLQLLLDDEERWVESFEAAVAPLVRSGDEAAVGRVMASTLAACPRLCDLNAALSSVLEQNVSVEVVLAFKRRTLSLSVRVSHILAAALPALPKDALPVFVRILIGTAAGLWPMAHPSEPTRTAMEDPELEVLQTRFEKDLATAVTALLRGLSASSADSR